MNHGDGQPASAPVAMPAKGPGKPRLRYAWWRVALASAVAIPADIVLFLFDFVPMVGVPIDLGVAVLIWLLLGRPTLLLGVLFLEAIPGVGLLPYWTLVVGAIAFLGMVPGRNPSDPRLDATAALGEATRSLLSSEGGGRVGSRPGPGEVPGTVPPSHN